MVGRVSDIQTSHITVTNPYRANNRSRSIWFAVSAILSILQTDVMSVTPCKFVGPLLHTTTLFQRYAISHYHLGSQFPQTDIYHDANVPVMECVSCTRWNFTKRATTTTNYRHRDWAAQWCMSVEVACQSDIRTTP